MELEILNQIFQLCIIPLLIALSAFAVKWINAKSEEIKTKTDNELYQKYLEMLTKTITDCVIATNQTYVNALKNQNAFDKKAQQEAFKMTYEAVLNILSEEAKEYLQDVMGDFNDYVVQKIEAEVAVNKSE
mgnify:CR=1 FL=1